MSSDQFILHREELEEIDARQHRLRAELIDGAELVRSVLSRVWEAHPGWHDPVVPMLMNWIEKHLPELE